MTKFLKLFDIIPGWLWALLLAGAGALALGQSYQVAHVERQHANLIADVARTAAERERVARVDAEQVARAQFRHAEMQQENSNEARKREVARLARERALAADNQRLRDAILAAPGRGQEGGAATAASGSDGDLARQLAGDLAEAVGLQGEAEAALRKRDDEVKTLLQQIHIDREAVSGAQQGK